MPKMQDGILGIKQIADLLKMSIPATRELVNTASFPEPLQKYRVRCWASSDIMAYIKGEYIDETKRRLNNIEHETASLHARLCRIERNVSILLDKYHRDME